MFRVGQKVVCVNPVNDLVLDRIYTVLGVHIGPIGSFISVDQTLEASANWSFYTHRFRPVVERKTDISVFQAMLKPAKTAAPAHSLSSAHDGGAAS